jgi:hypothetical protein
MAKRNYGTISGKCSHCGINLYAELQNRPHSIAMPCNLRGCPFETREAQQQRYQEDMKVLPASEGMTYYEG